MKDINIMLIEQMNHEFFNVEQPTHLFHYTSHEGLLGILSAKELWATHIKFLNDTSEYRASFEEIKEIIKLKPYMGMLNRYHRLTITPRNSETYVFSLSEEPDSLSQWRAYCPRGGYSVGFNLVNLFSSVENPKKCRMSLYPCIYDPELQKRALQSIVDYYLDDPERSDLAIENTREQFMDAIDFFMPCFKNQYFNEEKEWRLILQYPKGESDAHFRPLSSCIVPFVKLKMDSDLGFKNCKVIVSPGTHQHECALSASMLLASNGIIANPICSSIPYRKW